jgi:hypothetical protein
MKFFDLRSVFAVAALALLAACGGAPADQADAPATTAAVMAYGPAPIADCDAEGSCHGPRIIDGMAEQYRASAIALQQAEQQQALQPVQAAEQLPAALPGQSVDAAIEAAPAAVVQAQ